MMEQIRIEEERISEKEYIDFLKRTDLGLQYPKERFEERISKLVRILWMRNQLRGGIWEAGCKGTSGID